MPDDHVESISPVYACMTGTNQKNPRCIALGGTIGEQVSCNMYQARSSSCKQVQIADSHCNKARLAHHMIAFVQIESDIAENDDNFEIVI